MSATNLPRHEKPLLSSFVEAIDYSHAYFLDPRPEKGQEGRTSTAALQYIAQKQRA